MPKQPKIEIRKLAEFDQDDLNANKGTQRGRGMIEDSLRELGAGRSLVADRNGRLIAGNKTQEAAYGIGMEDALVVESDGTLPVIILRTDLDLDSEDGKARKLAILDNRTSEVGLSWDHEALRKIAEQQPAAVQGAWFSTEWDNMMAQAAAEAAQAEKDPTEPLDPVGDAETSATDLKYLHFDQWKIPLTEDEYDDLKAAVQAWVNEAGTLYGFVANLITRSREFPDGEEEE